MNVSCERCGRMLFDCSCTSRELRTHRERERLVRKALLVGVLLLVAFAIYSVSR